ncbi:MAG: AraC family transcriptional regulator [Oscillospiraceae bacterium]|nr:AraC family transcriptional regulator [Oscillospiraceae bacterium]
MNERYKLSFKTSGMDNVELSIFNCGTQSCEAGHTWGPGARDHYLIHYILRGCGTYTVGGRTYRLGAGDIFLARPSQIISYRADDADPWEYYWVGFNGSSANKLILQLPFEEGRPVHHCQNAERIKDALYHIFLSRGASPRDEMLMVGYLYLFIAELMQEALDQEKRPANVSAQYVFNALKYIQFNYFHDISIDDIAKAVGISRSHLYRVFMNNIGQSPIDYLTGYRINEACYLLKTSQLSIAEIAVSVGFFDQFYFSRVFKKHKGVPPSKYLAVCCRADSPEKAPLKETGL